MDGLTFDQAIELLEITDISKVKIADIPQLEKKLKKRWHPDRVIHLNDPAITKEYTEKFQQIETACQMLYSYLQGTYQAGEAFTPKSASVHEEPEEIIRRNAPEMQTKLKDLWKIVKEKGYKWTVQDVMLSDGFKLKDLLHEDFKEDIAMLSVVSFFYGMLFFVILVIIGYAINPILGDIIAGVALLQSLSCFLGFIPLSRFWLPKEINGPIIWFINLGLKVYDWAEYKSRSGSDWVKILVALPNLFALGIKYIILFPLYELAKVFVGHKIVGVVKQKVNYYADAAEWYIDELIKKNPDKMTGEELFHLSYLYSEFSDVKSYAPSSSETAKYASAIVEQKTKAAKQQQTEEGRNKGLLIAGVVILIGAISFGVWYFIFKNDPVKDGQKTAIALCDCYKKQNTQLIEYYQKYLSEFDSYKFSGRDAARKKLDSLSQLTGKTYQQCYDEAQGQLAKTKEKYITDVDGIGKFDLAFNNQQALCDNNSNAFNALLTQAGDKINAYVGPVDREKAKQDSIASSAISGEFKLSSGNCMPYLLVTITGDNLLLQGIDYSGSSSIKYSETYVRSTFDKSTFVAPADNQIQIKINNPNQFTFSFPAQNRYCSFIKTNSSVSSPSETLTIQGDKVRVRKEPNTTSQILVELNTGTVCKIIGIGNKTETIGGKTDIWYNVVINDKTGWVFGSFTSKKKY